MLVALFPLLLLLPVVMLPEVRRSCSVVRPPEGLARIPCTATAAAAAAAAAAADAQGQRFGFVGGEAATFTGHTNAHLKDLKDSTDKLLINMDYLSMASLMGYFHHYGPAHNLITNFQHSLSMLC